MKGNQCTLPQVSGDLSVSNAKDRNRQFDLTIFFMSGMLPRSRPTIVLTQIGALSAELAD